MPGRLTLFGCLHLPICADDLTLPAFVAILVRFMALVACAILYGVGISFSQVVLQNEQVGFVALSLSTFVLTYALYIALFACSQRGDIMQPHMRTHQTVLILQLLTYAYVLEFAVFVYAIVLMANSQVIHDVAMFTVEILTAIGIALDLVCVSCTVGLLAVLSHGKPPRKMNAESYSGFMFRVLQLGSYACLGGFGWLPSSQIGTEAMWSEISHVIHVFLKDSLMDFTVTDLLCALLLVRMEQHEEEEQLIQQANNAQAPSIRVKAQQIRTAQPMAEAEKVLDEFAEFAPYMSGIYGWKLAAVETPLELLRSVPSLLRRKFWGDGAEIEYAVFQNAIGGVDHSKRQILFSSFTSYLGQALPYTITVDHEKRAVVIAMRGTMSMSDIAMDLLCQPEPMSHAEKRWGVKNGSKHYVHRGMLHIASRIRADIDTQQILHRLFRSRTGVSVGQKGVAYDPMEVTQEDRASFLKAMGREPTEDFMYHPSCYVNAKQLDEMDCSKYRLICCGHSLGACMAAILAVLLKEEFPQVRALGYASASAVSSKELSESCVDYVSSMTTGKDIFGRLSWLSLTNLRERVLNTLRRCRVNKFKVMTSFFRPNSRARDYLYAEDEVPQDDKERKRVQEWIEQFRDNFPVNPDPEAASALLPIQRIPMFMPGKVFYLEKKHTEQKQRGGKCCLPSKTFKYQAMQVMDRAEMQNIQVTSRLILDHMPNHLIYAIHQCLKDKESNGLTVKE